MPASMNFSLALEMRDGLELPPEEKSPAQPGHPLLLSLSRAESLLHTL